MKLKPIKSLDELRNVEIGKELLYSFNAPNEEHIIIGDFEELSEERKPHRNNNIFLFFGTYYLLNEPLKTEDMADPNLTNLYQKIMQPQNKSSEELGYNLHSFPNNGLVNIFSIEKD